MSFLCETFSYEVATDISFLDCFVARMVKCHVIKLEGSEIAINICDIFQGFHIFFVQIYLIFF